MSVCALARLPPCRTAKREVMCICRALCPCQAEQLPRSRRECWAARRTGVLYVNSHGLHIRTASNDCRTLEGGRGTMQERNE
eukprot:3114723-Rhodomonas_salina.1